MGTDLRLEYPVLGDPVNLIALIGFFDLYAACITQFQATSPPRDLTGVCVAEKSWTVCRDAVPRIVAALQSDAGNVVEL
jgi:hypothetical protein